MDINEDSNEEMVKMEQKEKSVIHQQLNPQDRKKKVGNYLLGQSIGEGSFAKVRQGIHIIAREKVAVKVVTKKALLMKEYVRRNVRREAIVLQKISHPNIVRMFEVMETENSYYLVLEYAEGGEFIKYLSQKKYLTELESQKFIRQIVSAVDHMHRSSIVHRDLKLENFLLDKDANIKLIDFGLSNVFYGESSLVTQCGSPAYAAPEIFNNQRYGPAVDIWSIGICLYAMVIGKLPFVPQPPNNISQLHELILKGCEIPEDLSEECRGLLGRMLEVDEKKRIRMEELLKHPWVTENNSISVLRQPILQHVTLEPPHTSVVNYMKMMFNYKEKDILTALEERKVNAIAATYSLLHKRVEEGFHLAGFSMESLPVKKEASIYSIPRTGKEVILQDNNVYVTESENMDNRVFKPESYRNYIQYLKDSRQRTNPKFKQRENSFIRRIKAKGNIPRPYHSYELGQRSKTDMDSPDEHPNFRLTFSPTHEKLYEWGPEGIVQTDKVDSNSNKAKEVKERVKESKEEKEEEGPGSSESSTPPINSTDTLNFNKHLATPPPPPNTSHGQRKDVSDNLQSPASLSHEKFPNLNSGKTLQNTPKPQSPLRFQRSQRAMSEPMASIEKEHFSFSLADPCPSEAWGPFQKQKSKLYKGSSFVLNRSKTIYAHPISSQKFLTPRENLRTFDDIRQATIIGKGRLLVERIQPKINTGLDTLNKPKAHTARKVRSVFPDVVSSANPRSKSETGHYNIEEKETTNDVVTPLPDVIEPIKGTAIIPPVERIIADDETPMMRIRITSCFKQ